jgi:hypothetical protein
MHKSYPNLMLVVLKNHRQYMTNSCMAVVSLYIFLFLCCVCVLTHLRYVPQDHDEVISISHMCHEMNSHHNIKEILCKNNINFKRCWICAMWWIHGYAHEIKTLQKHLYGDVFFTLLIQCTRWPVISWMFLLSLWMFLLSLRCMVKRKMSDFWFLR